MNLYPFFKMMAERQASDLFITAGSPVQVKIQGVIYPVNKQVLDSQQVKSLAYELMTEDQRHTFEAEWEMNFGYPIEELGNFRVNIFKQRGHVGMVVRFIRATSPGIDELRLPEALKGLIMEKRGLIFVVGSTGSGKTSTITAMLEHRNTITPGHILTIEDPIEYIYPNRKSIVNQREVGIDTHSFSDALKNAMREAPDVLMIGEIRDKMTMQHALTYAQAGHLIVSTLHANNSYHSMNRIINFFPHEARESLLMDLSVALKAVISQRLVKNLQGQHVPAVEVMINTGRIADLIKNGEIDQMKDAMEHSLYQGSQTFEQALYKLYRAGEITYEEALTNADSASNLAWLVNNAQSQEEIDADRSQRRLEKEAASQAAAESETSFDIDLH
ncbi:PilT/PilU family type 4a pilus ATPase [Chitinimonas sp. BJB300]|uniref:PilT/PilU family type 4a pilus ATPase n=1 Tax=Chitinimonas sp. BJB300 TaxID=1559339 RepID=UPI000C118056|nr:PilT/PilU family type 4a pilus ATPase [Chitinimonas sp. BJB300]PHV10300.1 type IV pili twitching motility protein PilT [Chitinimonas sp. BJB300]TSJ90806.1 PilT/PilU family type 4a pilus ATPase [Chitinimonas sp. BJB300]